MTRMYGAALAAVLAVLAAGGWNAVQAAHRWVTAPAQARASGALTPHDRAVRAQAGGAWDDLVRAERAVVFVFSPGCEVSRANMANWTEIIRAAKNSGVALFAAGPVDATAAAEYWGPLGAHVRLIPTNPQGLDSALGVRVTPVTLVVEKGRIRGTLEGPLRIAAMEQLWAVIRGAGPERET
jgi:hypothetical protein